MFDRLALEAELGLTIGSHGTPSLLRCRLPVVTNGIGLPGLIESLEVESVVAPVEERAEAVLVEGGGVVLSAFGVTVVSTNYAQG